jgi:hypothetical protein
MDNTSCLLPSPPSSPSPTEASLHGQGLSPSDSWWPAGHLTVCLVHWTQKDVSDGDEFCTILKRCLPPDTQFFGCKRTTFVNSYMALIGFDCRLLSWAGLEDHLRLVRDNGEVDTLRLSVDVCQSGSDCLGEFIEVCSSFCVDVSDGNTFGQLLKVKEAKDLDKEPRCLDAAGDMWLSTSTE